MSGGKRILYVQYSNPGGYPPLLHSSRLLARSGWDVLFLGTGASGADTLNVPENQRISCRRLRFSEPGIRQKLHFLHFCVWCLLSSLRFRPSWIYASDMRACPAAMLIRMLCRIPIIYHEHDIPQHSYSNGLFTRLQFALRRMCAREAQICVIPNAERARIFAAEQGVNALVVWNCPRLEEISEARGPLNGTIRLLYHGSLSPELLPLSIIDALAELPAHISLALVGYETTGTSGYVKQLLERAEARHVRDRIEYRGPLSRSDLMRFCRTCDAGLALLPDTASNPNLRYLAGASNKVFDYLACGLPLITLASPDWDAIFIRSGYGVAAASSSAGDIAAAIRRLCSDPVQLRAMGEAGRKRIRKEWNYETQFRPVWQFLNSV